MSNFDEIIDRRPTASSKWSRYAGTDILPFWVADMEFRTPEFILDAVRQRLEHGILGYTNVPPGLVEAAVDWYERVQGWRIEPEWIVWLPGVVPGFNLAARAVAAAPDASAPAVLIPTPVYYPFLGVAANAGQQEVRLPLARQASGWEMPMEEWSAQLSAAPAGGARTFMLCNPQNPTGRIYTRRELEALADWCLRENLIICSDEIHCSLLLAEGRPHLPIASLDPAIASRSITLFAPTKTYNMPGLSCALAIIPDPDLRRRFRRAQAGLTHSPGPLAFAAAEAAFRDEGPWLPDLLRYLRGNEQLLRERLGALPGVSLTPVEATYLAWLDVRPLALAAPGTHFEAHGLGLSDGAPFAGPGFVRFNFGCPRSLLEQGLARFAAGVQAAREALRS